MQASVHDKGPTLSQDCVMFTSVAFKIHRDNYVFLVTCISTASYSFGNALKINICSCA